MAYIGTIPSNGVRRVHTYTATASQTTFSGASSEGVTLSYADTNYIDVFQNGVLLGSADYTSTSGTSVVLASGAPPSDQPALKNAIHSSATDQFPPIAMPSLCGMPASCRSSTCQ